MTKSLAPEKVERLRKKLYDKAKQEPSFRFYTLYDKVCRLESLQYAYALAKANKGAPGVDGIRFEEIEAQGVEQWLGELRDELVKETYRPQPVRRVMIPKAGGGERPLGIPTIRDRVVQTAAVLYLEPIFEADFEDNLYGYRPGRSAHDALKEVQKRLWDRTTHVVDADLSKYFDSIPHVDLLKSVARRVSDGKMLRLIKLWLKSPVVEQSGTKGPRITGGKKCKQGVPQGGVISPLLANIYINRFVRHWEATGASEKLGVIINYADDFVIMCKSRGQAVASLAQAGRWLEKLGLTLNGEKTRLCYAWKEEFDFLGYTFGPRCRPDTGTTHIGAHPSKKSIKRFKGKVNQLLYRGNPTPWPLLQGRLNRMIMGWANYFSYGSLAKVYQAVGWHVATRVHRFLSRRHNLRARGGRFWFSEIHGPLGVTDIGELYRKRKRSAHALP